MPATELAKTLTDLGVRESLLDDEQRRSLREDGYVVLPGLLDPASTEQLAARVDQLVAEEGGLAGAEFGREEGTDRLADLVNKGEEFDVCFTHPSVLVALWCIFAGRQFKLSSLHARSALPGRGLQGLHPDWGGVQPAGEVQVANSIWMLDPFTADNGATRVVPGTHLSGLLSEMSDPRTDHLRQQLLTGPAGTVVVFNAHLWHGGTCNSTRRPRRAIHGYWTRSHNPQQDDQRSLLRPATRRRLDPARRVLLDIPEK
jgi:ectoine hydroxylase-related dioxygenase (phytanoyl-CoA dioxygenase family)